METTPPRRRVVLDLNIQGDSWEDIQDALKALITEIAVEGSLSTNSSCGGYNYGWRFTSSEDPSITHESFKADLDTYLKTIPKPIITPSFIHGTKCSRCGSFAPRAFASSCTRPECEYRE